VELVRRIGRNIDRLARPHDGLLAAERSFQFAFEQNERFFEVMPVRRRPAAGRDVHIDDAKASRSVLAADGDGVGVAHQPNVGQAPRGVPIRAVPIRAVPINIRPGESERAMEVVRGNRRVLRCLLEHGGLLSCIVVIPGERPPTAQRLKARWIRPLRHA